MMIYFIFVFNFFLVFIYVLWEEVCFFFDGEFVDYFVVKKVEMWMGYDKMFSKKMGD